MRLRTLIIFLIIFTIKQLYLIFLIPPWEAPDETAHVGYVMYLYNQHDYPSIKKPFSPLSIEQSMQTSRTMLKQLKQNVALSDDRRELYNRFTYQLAPETPNVASHPPLYYLSLLPLYHLSLFLPSYWTIIFLRAGTLIWSIIGLILVYHLAQKIRGNNTFSLFVVTLVGLQPMYSFISSIVNNDILVVVAFLLLLLRGINLISSKEYTISSAVIDGLLLGGATLIKPQLFIGFILYLGACYLRKIPLRLVFLSIAASVLVSSWWYTRQFFLEGTGMASYAIQNFQSNPQPFWNYPIEFIQSKQPMGIFMSFWGFFGWLDVPMRKPIYGLFIVFICLGLYGLWRGRQKLIIGRDNFQISKLLVLAFVSYSLAIFMFDVQSFRLSHRFLIQGRYLAPILPLLILVLTSGVWSFRKKYRRYAQLMSVLIFITVQFLMFITISRAYFGDYLPRLLLHEIYIIM